MSHISQIIIGVVVCFIFALLAIIPATFDD